MSSSGHGGSLQGVVLVGGEGRRLRPLTDTRPKPMMELVDRPFVAHQLDHLARYGVDDIIFSCGYRPDVLREHFGDGSDRGIRLRYVVDPEPLGTAGAVRNASELIEADRVLVFNGDILTDLDLAGLLDQHVSRGAEGTVALTPVEDPSAYGLVRLRDDRSVEEFLEKPSPHQLRPGEPYLINAGTYVLERRSLDRIPPGVKVSIERDTFPLIADDRLLYGYPSEAYWRDIGTPASYLDAHLDVLGGEVRTEAPGGPIHLGPGASVDPGATLVGPVSLGADVRVESGARVARAVVGAGCRVGREASVEGSILGRDVVVEDDAHLSDLVVAGDGARVPAGRAISGPASIPTGGEPASVGANQGDVSG